MVFRVDRVNRGIIISNYDNRISNLVVVIDILIAGCNVGRWMIT